MRKALVILTVVRVGAGGVAAYNRVDCPGTKVCPLTGQVICVDRCPVQK